MGKVKESFVGVMTPKSVLGHGKWPKWLTGQPGLVYGVWQLSEAKETTAWRQSRAKGPGVLYKAWADSQPRESQIPCVETLGGDLCSVKTPWYPHDTKPGDEPIYRKWKATFLWEAAASPWEADASRSRGSPLPLCVWGRSLHQEMKAQCSDSRGAWKFSWRW